MECRKTTGAKCMTYNVNDWIKEGELAYLYFIAEEDCPYDEGTEPYDAWLKGWNHEADFSESSRELA